MEKTKKSNKDKLKAIPHKKSTIIIYFVIRILILLEIVSCIIRRDYHSVFIGTLSLFLLLLPSIMERKLNIDLPDTLEIIIMLFIYAAEILGEINSFYITVPHWDTVLHTINGFLCAAVGFSMIDLFNRNERFSFKLSPLYLAIAAFCFSMTVGVVWEFFEFGCDQLLALDMQKDYVVNQINTVALDSTQTNTVVKLENIKDVIIVYSDGTQKSLGLGGYLDIGLIDTMKDLFVNFIGAVIFSTIGYFFVKNRGKHSFAAQFIPQLIDEEEIEDNETEETDEIEEDEFYETEEAEGESISDKRNDDLI